MADFDQQTLAAYAGKIDDYISLTGKDAPDRAIQAFIDAMPAAGRVLDLGCGPGNSAAQMIRAGLKVDATDASKEMIQAAKDHFNVRATLATFADLNATHLYDGVFANFSLLHAPKSDFSGHLKRIHTALKPGGTLHLGMKTGTGEGRDALGRFYAYYSIDELTVHLTTAGFSTSWIQRTGQAHGLAGDIEPFVILRTDA